MICIFYPPMKFELVFTFLSLPAIMQELQKKYSFNIEDCVEIFIASNFSYLSKTKE